MKNHLALAIIGLLLLMVNNAWSQKPNHSFTHWSGIELGFPYLNQGSNQALPDDHNLAVDNNNSISFRFNFVEKKWSNTETGTGFLSGLSFGIDSYDWKKTSLLRTMVIWQTTNYNLSKTPRTPTKTTNST